MKRAFLNVDALFDSSYPEANVIMVVHDEILLESPISTFSDKFAHDVVEAMQGDFHKLLGMDKPFMVEASFVLENWNKKIHYAL